MNLKESKFYLHTAPTHPGYTTWIPIRSHVVGVFRSPRTIHFTTIAWHRCPFYQPRGLATPAITYTMTTLPATTPLACLSFLSSAAPALGSCAASCECLYRSAFLLVERVKPFWQELAEFRTGLALAGPVLSSAHCSVQC